MRCAPFLVSLSSSPARLSSQLMECGATYSFTHPDQFWAELADIISLSPSTSSLDDLDYALRSYLSFASAYQDEYLSTPATLDRALYALIDSSFFNAHLDRMTSNLILVLHPSASPSSLFLPLMLVLHLGLANPSTVAIVGGVGGSGGDKGGKVFKAMRREWNEVVPVLIKCVVDAGVVDGHLQHAQEGGGDGEVHMPDHGWKERVGTAATAVLYEVCRVQRLSPVELSLFNYDFIKRLFRLVERTRDAEDETFNYSLIKLIIALNEQFMVAFLPPPTPHRHHGAKRQGTLAPPILPTIVGKDRKEKGKEETGEGTNLVLEVLKNCEGDSKTFGENIIFILNRANNTPDSLCVSLLILKILYLLFTTSGTQEYFYTNDLCVLVDVFIRELSDLGEESEGLKHTYLRVLHPLLQNTQLRHHAHKRPHLRRLLASLIASSPYREVDATTLRLVERNLRGSWAEGLDGSSVAEGEMRGKGRKGEGSAGGRGWSSGMGAWDDRDGAYIAAGVDKAVGGKDDSRRVVSEASLAPSAALGRWAGTSGGGSSLSVNEVAQADDFGARKLPKSSSSGLATVQQSTTRPLDMVPTRSQSPASFLAQPPTLHLEIPRSHLPVPSSGRRRSTSLLSPMPLSSASSGDPSPFFNNHTTASTSPSSALSSTPPVRSVSAEIPRRRRAPPAPPESTSRARTPSSNSTSSLPSTRASTPTSTVGGQNFPPTGSSTPRRAAPDPPRFKTHPPGVDKVNYLAGQMEGVRLREQQ